MEVVEWGTIRVCRASCPLGIIVNDGWLSPVLCTGLIVVAQAVAMGLLRRTYVDWSQVHRILLPSQASS
jgi:hypothetical protein